MKRTLTLLGVLLVGCSGGGGGGTGGGSGTGGGAAAGGGSSSAGGGAAAGGGSATGGGSAAGGGTASAGGGAGGGSAAGGGSGGPDLSCSGAMLPTTAPATIMISGTTVAPGQTSTPLGGATVVAATTGGTMLGMATSASDGTFSISVSTSGAPVDLVLKATASGRLETDWYPSVPVSGDLAVGEINVFDSSTLGLLGLVAGYTVSTMRSQIFADLRDCADVAISGATASSNPAASVTRYIKNGVPSSSASATDSDGALLFGNTPTGDVAISGMSGSTALRTKHVASAANIVIQAQLSP